MNRVWKVTVMHKLPVNCSMKARKTVTAGIGGTYGGTNALDAKLLIFTPVDVGFCKQN